MLNVLLLSFVIFALVMAMMAVGVLFNRKPISGSCGGVNAITGEKSACVCASPCEKKRKANTMQDQPHDVEQPTQATYPIHLITSSNR
ncbi:MAG TPA: (Na+)-NQR maturation NqrM [Thiothrix sp.]|nr:(Na+)-NQR maturation NqrM [Thiothrix sp.]